MQTILTVFWRVFLLLYIVLQMESQCRAKVESAEWNDQGRAAKTLLSCRTNNPIFEADSSCTISLWIRLNGDADTFPTLAANKSWEAGDIVDLISTSNMGITRSTGTGRGWALALQPNGSWHWNLGNGEQRLDYLPTAERQPINDGAWHLIAFTIDRQSKTAHLYYDGINVAIYAINGFDDLSTDQDAYLGGDQPATRSAIDGLSGQFQIAECLPEALSDDQIFAIYRQKFPQAARNMPDSPIDELNVLAWNIWHGARHPGIDTGIQQAIDFIEHSQADVITMQETYGSGPIIADRLGYYFYLRSSNLSVMSRFPIVATHDLYEPFRFGGVTLRLNDQQKANVFSLWIHYLPAWRRDAAADSASAEAIIAGEWKTRASELQDILKQLQPFIDRSDEVPLIVGGDFNSPSTLDWTDDTAEWHNGLTIDWPVSRQMLDHGFTDTYRAIHPEPTRHEPHDLFDGDAQKITQRIDYIYTQGPGITPIASRMMNTHNGTWPSDHPAVLSKLSLQAETIRVISYNILEGFRNPPGDRFPSGNQRREAVSNWLADQAPAIVGFQELNGYTQERLAEESLAWGHGHAATVKEGGYVVGLTSREPIDVIERHLDGMHHGMLHARTMGIDCFVVHLSPFRAAHRLREAQMIVERAKRILDAGRPVIVMGDFNALSPQDRSAYDNDSELLERMRRGDARHAHVENLVDDELDYRVMQIFLDAGLVDLFAKQRNADLPPGKRRIDYIFASPDLAVRLQHANWHTSGQFNAMSDHPPTSATLLLPLAAQPSTRQLRVLSYNIHHAQGTDGRFDYQRLANVIRSASPDLVAIQEVDRKTQRADGVDQVKILAELAGMPYYYFAESMPYQGGGYGNAILSKMPITNTKTIALDVPEGLEPRAVGLIDVAPWGNRGPTITFASTHFSNESSQARLGQARLVNRLFQHPKMPTLIAGDFNFRPDSEPYESLAPYWFDAATRGSEPHPTSPAGTPRSRIDYVFAHRSHSWQAVDVQVLDEPVASDHRPVLATLQLAPTK